MNNTTKLVVGLAVVAVLGAGAYYLYQKAQREKGTAPVTVDSANDNQRSNSGLADNINAGVGAFNSLTKAFGYGSV